MKLYIVFLCVLFCTHSNAWFFADFSEEDCIKAKDGYIWKINRKTFNNYFVQGWYEDQGWGNNVEMEQDILSEKRGYVKIECPRFKAQ